MIANTTKCLSILVLLLVSSVSAATDSLRISRIKCEGGWIGAGNSKLEVVSYCGAPSYSDVVSGANQEKQENLLYTIKGKDYILSFKGGKLVYLGKIK